MSRTEELFIRIKGGINETDARFNYKVSIIDLTLIYNLETIRQSFATQIRKLQMTNPSAHIYSDVIPLEMTKGTFKRN